MKPKEIFWSGLKGGLFEEKHRKAMGEALWLFGWLCTRQNRINERQEGLPHYGHALTRQEIHEDTGFSKRNIKLWTKKLAHAGYIRTSRDGNEGLIFYIQKAKSKARSARAEEQILSNNVGQYHVRPTSRVGHPDVQRGTLYCPTYADKSLTSQADSEITKTLSSKDLSKENNTGAAKTAALSLSVLAREKSIPRGKSLQELDETRRRLLRQSEELKANVKYRTARD